MIKTISALMPSDFSFSNFFSSEANLFKVEHFSSQFGNGLPSLLQATHKWLMHDGYKRMLNEKICSCTANTLRKLDIAPAKEW